jgi:hypothetical protein
MNRFAPITSSLLARKGHAGPSATPSVKLPFVWPLDKTAADAPADAREPPGVGHANGHVAPLPKPVLEFKKPSSEPRSSSEPRGPGGAADRPRKISVALSAREHETLAIIAVKRGLTKHQIVRDALDAYFGTLAREYRTQCSCIATGCSCSGECSAS